MTKVENIIITNSPKEVTLQEELADVYFSKKPHVKTESHVVPIQKKRMRFFPIVPILSVLVVLMAIVIFVQRFSRQDIRAFRQSIKTAETVKVIEEGKLNKFIIDVPRSQGALPGDSAQAQRTFLTLGTSALHKPSLVIDFVLPIDISGKSIFLYAKGKRGGEEISLTMRDSNKKSYHFSNIYLDSKWVRIQLPLARISGIIDVTDIKQMRIEYEAAAQPAQVGKKNELQREVYIKDITFVKNIR